MQKLDPFTAIILPPQFPHSWQQSSILLEVGRKSTGTKSFPSRLLSCILCPVFTGQLTQSAVSAPECEEVRQRVHILVRTSSNWNFGFSFTCLNRKRSDRKQLAAANDSSSSQHKRGISQRVLPSAEVNINFQVYTFCISSWFCCQRGQKVNLDKFHIVLKFLHRWQN